MVHYIQIPRWNLYIILVIPHKANWLTTVLLLPTMIPARTLFLLRNRKVFGLVSSLRQCIDISSRKESACISFNFKLFSLFFSLIDEAKYVKSRLFFFNKTATALRRSISLMLSLLTAAIMFVTLP